MTSDGLNVFVIHNSDDTVGNFDVLDASDGSSIYTFANANGPFSPMGFYPDPSPGGNYPAGERNENSIALWGYKPSPTAQTGENGGTWAFQMPLPNNINGPNATELIAYGLTDWRNTAAPLIAASGQQAYWLVSRSKVRAWINVTWVVGGDGSADFDRGVPPFRAAPYTAAVNDLENPTIMCGGSAASQISCSNTADFNATIWLNDITPSLIFADPLFSVGATRLYWVSDTGNIAATDPATGTVLWSADTGVDIEANFALSSDGAFMYFADITGNVIAWQLAESSLATVGPMVPMPTTSGAGEPTSSPMPSGMSDTDSPTSLDTSSPSAGLGSAAPSSPPSGATTLAVSSVVIAAFVGAAALLF